MDSVVEVPKNMNYLPRKLKFDAPTFYTKGGSIQRLDRHIYDNLARYLDTLDWEDKPDEHSLRSVKTLEASTAHKVIDANNPERYEGYRRAARSCPQELRNIVESVILSPSNAEMASFYNFEVRLFELWEGADDSYWHWDIQDGTDAFFLIYVSDHNKWPNEYGGQLEVGVVNIDGDMTNRSLITYNHDIAEIDSIGFVPPEKQTYIWVNNVNPMFLHRVIPLQKTDEKRRVLQVGFRLIAKPDRFAPTEITWE